MGIMGSLGESNERIIGGKTGIIRPSLLCEEQVCSLLKLGRGEGSGREREGREGGQERRGR